jgi:hypothetical protein
MKKRVPRSSLRPYNGFGSEERLAAGRVIQAAIRDGLLARPSQCSVCRVEHKSGARLFCHLEDYRQPLAVYPICGRCHFFLHARFREPERWRGFLAGMPAGWFKLLTLDPKSRMRPFDETYPEGLPPP